MLQFRTTMGLDVIQDPVYSSRWYLMPQLLEQKQTPFSQPAHQCLHTVRNIVTVQANKYYHMLFIFQVDPLETKYQRDMASSKLRELLATEDPVEKVKYFTIELPKKKDHSHHEVGKVSIILFCNIMFFQTVQ